MDWLTFFAVLVKVLAWPIVVVVAVFSLRRPLFSLLQNVDRLKYGDLDISFSRELADVEGQLDAVQFYRSVSLAGLPSGAIDVSETINRLAAISPKGAVIEAWALLEGAIKAYGEKEDPDRYKDHPEVKKEAEVTAIIGKLHKMRNYIAHDPKANITAKQAIHYGYLLERLLALIASVSET